MVSRSPSILGTLLNWHSVCLWNVCVLKIWYSSLSLTLLGILENRNHRTYIVSFSVSVHPMVLIFLDFHLYSHLFDFFGASGKPDASEVPLILMICFLSLQLCLFRNSQKWNQTEYSLLTGSFQPPAFEIHSHCCICQACSFQCWVLV